MDQHNRAGDRVTHAEPFPDSEPDLGGDPSVNTDGNPESDPEPDTFSECDSHRHAFADVFFRTGCGNSSRDFHQLGDGYRGSAVLHWLFDGMRTAMAYARLHHHLFSKFDNLVCFGPDGS